MQCKHCGAEVESEYRLCPYCRTELEYPTQNNSGGQPTIIVQNVISSEKALPKRNNVDYAVRNIACGPKSKKLTLILAIALGFFWYTSFLCWENWFRFYLATYLWRLFLWLYL